MIKYSKAELIEMISRYTDTGAIVGELGRISQRYAEMDCEESVSYPVSSASVRLVELYCYLYDIRAEYTAKHTCTEDVKDLVENFVSSSSEVDILVVGLNKAGKVIEQVHSSSDELWFVGQAIQNLEGMFNLLMEFYKLYLMSEIDNDDPGAW